MNNPNTFVLIVDKDGDAAELVTLHDDIIWSIVRILDRDDPDYAPHRPLLWDGSDWREWR